MKKTLSLLVILFVFSGCLFSQSFDDGTNLFAIGFGIPPARRIVNDFDTKYNKDNYFDRKLKNYGTVLMKYEHGLHKYFGVGLNMEYSGASLSYKYDSNNSLRYEYQIKSNVFGFYLRMNAHLPVSDKLDFYGGVGLGYLYTINKSKDIPPNASATIEQKTKILDFDYQFTFGARFMVKESVGLFAEVGWATTPAQIGVVFKF
jgi:hypothetical protein